LNDTEDVMRALVEQSLKAQALREEDYVEGGLLYCGKCHTRKQAIIDFMGEKVLVGVMCQCQQEAYEAQQAEDKRRQRYASVMQRVDWCDIRVRGQREQCHPSVLKYLDNWAEMLRRGMGLLLWGAVGTGKSTSAAYLVQALKRRFVPAVMTSFAQFGDVRTELPNFNGVDLLVLDDLGIERQTDFMRERAFEIVDSRARCGKPTVFTTNLTLEELKRRRDSPELPPAKSESETDASRKDRRLRDQRLYSRVLERTIPVKFTGPDFRAAHAQETLRAAQAFFKSGSGRGERT